MVDSLSIREPRALAGDFSPSKKKMERATCETACEVVLDERHVFSEAKSMLASMLTREKPRFTDPKRSGRLPIKANMGAITLSKQSLQGHTTLVMSTS